MNTYYSLDLSSNQATDAVLDLGYSEVVGNLYEEQTESVVGALTIKYIDDFVGKIFTASLNLNEITDVQFRSLLEIVAHLHYIEEQCQNCLTKDIDVVASVEGEFCFYRKSEKGLSLLSIDEDGDILFNFTGYKEGFLTNRYNESNSIDFEKIVYDFLSN